MSVAGVIGVGVLLWKIACMILRSNRSKFIASFDPINDAFVLCKITNFVEFPLLTNKALEFALFRTFAIPSISKILRTTRQFRTAAVKRYDDTSILLQECLLNLQDVSRGHLAIRRLNFIHGRYDISNSDYLYTLSVFVLEPPRFAAKYGFRKWTEKEVTANFVVWHDIGTRMGIRDIPQTVEEMDRFNRQYEAQNMVYCDSNRDIGDATLTLLLSTIPRSLRSMGKRIIFALFDEKLLDAMGYPRQPGWLVWAVQGVVRLCVGHSVGLFLPPRALVWSAERIPKNGMNSCTEEESVYKVRHDVYKPGSYPNGYKISGLGDAPSGMLGRAFDGDLLCPLRSSNEKKFR